MTLKAIFPHIQLFTEKAAAQLLSCSVKTLQSWRKNKKGPVFLKAERMVRYTWDDLSKWIQSIKSKQ